MPLRQFFAGSILTEAFLAKILRREAVRVNSLLNTVARPQDCGGTFTRKAQRRRSMPGRLLTACFNQVVLDSGVDEPGELMSRRSRLKAHFVVLL